VAATLQAAREAFPTSRLVAVFQPHLYSRTQQLAAEIGRSLLGADVAFVTDVYAAREEPIPGVTGERVVEAARASGHRNVRYAPDWRALPPVLAGELGEGDVLLTMGAGDVYRLAHGLAAEEKG
jgi:UDP-N-acetylmuramate--alanine ligase